MWCHPMNALTLNIPEQMLLALLRASLQEMEVETACFRQAIAEDWKRCYRLACAQGVMALAWDGVCRLPAALQPPLSVKLSWATGVEAYEKRYRRYCRTVDGLTRFYAGHGIATVQLKGVGLSTLYPVPTHREGGDIDIYTYTADRAVMSDAEANRLADDLMRRQGVKVDTEHTPKHSLFYWQGIPVENHKTFLNVERYRIALTVEQRLHTLLQPQEVVLPGAEGTVWIPSPAFNTLFVAFHAIQHYGCGLSLHHLCDWACLLRRYGLLLVPEGLDARFVRAIFALTRLCNRLLGTQVAVPDDRGLADRMLAEILHPRYGVELPADGKPAILVFKARRLFYHLRLRQEVLDEPLCRRLWQSFCSHLRHPETIFHGK